MSNYLEKILKLNNNIYPKSNINRRINNQDPGIVFKNTDEIPEFSHAKNIDYIINNKNNNKNNSFELSENNKNQPVTPDYSNDNIGFFDFKDDVIDTYDLSIMNSSYEDYINTDKRFKRRFDKRR